ncbi:MAG TPA: transglycosylase SLT domain-containing protein [Gallionellaceae bacterium]
MKTLLCILLLQFLSGWGLVVHAADDATAEGVYAFTAADGTVTLSNVPVDDRYQALIVEQARVVLEPQEAAPATAPVVPKTRHLRVRKASYNQIVEEAARRYGLESALLHAVISVESRYDPTVVSRAGAVGLMQLMPGTATRYGVTNSFDAVQNLQGGAQYLRDLLHMFNNNMSLALAAYNAGENAVISHGNRIPPNRETRKYVPKVLGYYRKYRKEL